MVRDAAGRKDIAVSTQCAGRGGWRCLCAVRRGLDLDTAQKLHEESAHLSFSPCVPSTQDRARHIVGAQSFSAEGMSRSPGPHLWLSL